jgi:hypothetical protein
MDDNRIAPTGTSALFEHSQKRRDLRLRLLLNVSETRSNTTATHRYTWEQYKKVVAGTGLKLAMLRR